MNENDDMEHISGPLGRVMDELGIPHEKPKPFTHFPYNEEEDECPYCKHRGHAYFRYSQVNQDKAILWMRCGACGKEFSQDR